MKHKEHHHFGGEHGSHHRHHHRHFPGHHFPGHDFRGGDLPGGRRLSSADLQLVILALLDAKASHGYELIKAISDHSSGYYDPSPGVIYPALMYLHELGYAKIDQDGTRKLYALTPEGKEHLKTNRATADGIWQMLSRIGGRMQDIREAFAGEHEFNSENAEEIHRARHALKDALRQKRGCGPEEALRIAKILDRATSEILSKA